MNKSKSLCSVTILLIALSVLAVQGSLARSAQFSASEKALPFLIDVAKLDVTRYNVTLTGYSVRENSSDWGGVYDETDVTYTLENIESKLDAKFNFVGDKLWGFHLYIDRGAPLYSEQPYTNVLERAKAFLQRYLDYTGSEGKEMKDTLAKATEIGNNTFTVGNVSLELKDYPSGSLAATSFTWRFIVNGAEFSRFGFTFKQNGEFATLDTRLINKIGSTDVNISLEEAIGIAREFVGNLTLKMGTDNPKYQNITFSSEPTWSLLTRTREPLTFYPYWTIGVRFDKTIIDGAAGLYGVYVSIWADTGEIISSQPMAIIGLHSDEGTQLTPSTLSSPQPSHTPQPSLTPQQSPLSSSPSTSTSASPPGQPAIALESRQMEQSTVILGGAIAATAVATTVVVLVYFKKRNRKVLTPSQ